MLTFALLMERELKYLALPLKGTPSMDLVEVQQILFLLYRALVYRTQVDMFVHLEILSVGLQRVLYLSVDQVSQHYI